jgi:hypothetical protein
MHVLQGDFGGAYGVVSDALRICRGIAGFDSEFLVTYQRLLNNLKKQGKF